MKLLIGETEKRPTTNCDMCFEEKKYGANVKNDYILIVRKSVFREEGGEVTLCKLVAESLPMKLKFKFQYEE